MRFIEHVIEPQKLLLSWQPSEGQDRGRRIVAELKRHGNDADLIYLRDSSDYKKALEQNFDGSYPGFSKDKDHQSVLAAFMRRLPPRNRTDFYKFLEAIRIPPGVNISDFALLGYAGAKLPSDDFFIIHPFDEAQPPFEFLLLIAGYRHYRNQVPYENIAEGMSAKFELEPGNPRDPEAVRIVIPDVANATAGYVCRGLLPQFRRWLENGWSVCGSVERRNGTADHPLIYLYVTVRRT